MEGKTTPARQSPDPLESDSLATVRALHEIALSVVLDPGAVFRLAPDVMGEEGLPIEDLAAARAFNADDVTSVHGPLLRGIIGAFPDGRCALLLLS
jgi:hypothetical protein